MWPPPILTNDNGVINIDNDTDDAMEINTDNAIEVDTDNAIEVVI